MLEGTQSVSVRALVPVVSHAEDVEGRVESTGDKDRHDHDDLKVVRDGQHGGQSQQHGARVQQPDRHVVAEGHDVSPLPAGFKLFYHKTDPIITILPPCVSSPVLPFQEPFGSS